MFRSLLVVLKRLSDVLPIMTIGKTDSNHRFWSKVEQTGYATEWVRGQ